MSYMNDVGVVIDKNAWQAFKEDLIANQEMDNDENLDFNRTRFLKGVKEINRDNNVVILLWKYQKWDEAIDEVVELFMNYIRDIDSSIRYIRIGEGVDDLEDINDCWFGDFDPDKNLIKVRRTAAIWLTGDPTYYSTIENS